LAGLNGSNLEPFYESTIKRSGVSRFLMFRY
jgi:hypothetical protein